MDAATVTLVNQITLSAAALIACGVLWRAYKSSHDNHLKDLREINQQGLYDLRARIMVLEDKAGVSRVARDQYIQSANDREKNALADLDMEHGKKVN